MLYKLWKNLIQYLILLVLAQVVFSEFCLSQSNIANGLSNKKVLVLIISSYDSPLYIELQKIWRSYMHKYPQNIEAYFINGDLSIAGNYQIVDDVIWLKTQESIRPGIINKTLMAMEAFLPILDQFDYVLRTNLSSFYVFSRLLKFLENRPKKCFFAGSGCSNQFISGSGFLLSTDLVELLVKNKHALFNTLQYDDVAISAFLRDHGIKFVSHARMDFLSLADWKKRQDLFPADIFQFRIKTPDALRITDDIYIHSQLLHIFYS